MNIPESGKLLRIFVSENDQWEHRPLYEAIVLKARELQLAGATVIRCPMGYGASSHLHTTKILRLSEELPIIVEIVDSEAKLEKILPFLDEAMKGGLVTVEDVKVLHYGATEEVP